MATSGELRERAEVKRKGIFKAKPRFPGSSLPKKNVKDSDFTKGGKRASGKKDTTKQRSRIDKALREAQGLNQNTDSNN